MNDKLNMVSCQVLRKLSYWKNPLLYWMMLTKASVRIWTLSNNDYVRKSSHSINLQTPETTYCGLNCWLTHKSNKKWQLSKKEILLKIFFLKVTVFNPRNSSTHPLLIRDVLIYVFQKSTCNNPLLHVQCIWQIFLFQEYCYFRGVLTATDFEWTISISVGHFQFLFRILCLFETSICSHFKGTD